MMNPKDIQAFYRIAVALNDEHRAIAARHQRMALILAKLYEFIPAFPQLKGGRRGQRNGNWAKVRQLKAQGLRPSEIARQLNMTPQNVHRCLSYKNTRES
jgi:hypothetical protein